MHNAAVSHDRKNVLGSIVGGKQGSQAPGGCEGHGEGVAGGRAVRQDFKVEVFKPLFYQIYAIAI